MRVVIIEDEKPAAEKLRKALLKTKYSVTVDAVLGSVEAATEWLKENDPPDLIFMDIELTDGLSFRIFDRVQVNCPIIFCTAYDEYWQEAFEHNSIDYLLKPLKQEKLEAALNKYEQIRQYFAAHLQQLLQFHQQPESAPGKKRFLVKRGADFVSIRTDDIAYFYATHKLVCLVDNNGQKFLLDQSLSDIENELDKDSFYRVNRKYLVNMNSIKKIRAFGKSKLQLVLDPAPPEDITVSAENAAAFKSWMGS